MCNTKYSMLKFIIRYRCSPNIIGLEVSSYWLKYNYCFMNFWVFSTEIELSGFLIYSVGKLVLLGRMSQSQKHSCHRNRIQQTRMCRTFSHLPAVSLVLTQLQINLLDLFLPLRQSLLLVKTKARRLKLSQTGESNICPLLITNCGYKELSITGFQKSSEVQGW